jgi:hypothetical protein
MLIAAMILGLIGGITYFVGGGAGVIGWADGTAPWWMISLIPIGAIGAMGAAMARTKPTLAGAIMLLAGAGAMGVGFASYKSYASLTTSAITLPIVVPVHAFVGSIVYFPVALLTLIIGGMLAVSSGKKTAADD